MLSVSLDRSRNRLARFAKNGTAKSVVFALCLRSLAQFGMTVAFTMAEILLSLTIIGVVAAITLPSLTGNINERTWNTQRKALYSRLSQAISLMPAINGYGTVREVTDSATGSTSLEDNAAETFITAGLSKVLKINNICDNEHLKDCGLNEKWTALNGSNLSLPQKLTDLNSGMLYSAGSLNIYNTKAAAFETINGESVLTFYNPNCSSEGIMLEDTAVTGDTGYFVKQQVCANFVFDLNGSRGPNTVGKDIGFISAVYPSDTMVVMPQPAKKLDSGYKQNEAAKACSSLDPEYRLPNIEELLAIYYNQSLIGEEFSSWSSTVIDADTAWFFGFFNGMKYPIDRELGRSVFCVKR